MHSTMQFIHTGGFTTPSLKEALNHFSAHWNPDVFGDEIKERSAFAQGIGIIQEYYKKENPSSAKIVDLEARFTIELDDPEKKDKHFVSGIIDRIDKTDEGFEIIDYKTSQKMPPQQSLDENLQLLIYLLAFLKRYPHEQENLEKVDLSLFFLHHCAKLSTKKTQEDLQRGREEVLEIIHEIEESDFPAVVNPLCDWCGYQKICPMWRHKFKGQKTEIKNQEGVIGEFLQLNDQMKKDRMRVAELKEKILEIMQQEETERLFGQGKIIAKTARQTFAYDEKKLRELLEKEDLWDQVVKFNQIQLKKILATLPSPLKKEIEKLKELSRESWGLSVRKEK